MLFGNEKSVRSQDIFNSFSFSIRQKARTPIRQSINFSDEALTKAAVRKVMQEAPTKRAYTMNGSVEAGPVGHLLNATA